MKNNSVITFILTNSLCLLFLGTILASCEKKSFYSTGHFSKMVPKEVQRHPANVQKQFIDYQDPKQIYLYCKASDINVKSCYEFHLTKKARSFVRKNKNNSLESILSEYKFENIREKIKKINKSLVKIFKPKIDSIVEKRIKYCNDANVLNKQRCHTQFINKESTTLSNSFKKASSLHGYEYLHLNSVIKDELEKKLI